MKNPTYRRIVALDVARGIAILGTLATNIWVFATWHLTDELGMPYLDPGYTVWGELRASPDTIFNALSYLVTDGKFLGLLSIMFGIGIEIQRQSALSRGHRWPGRYYWRAALLVIEGLLNYIFIFEFDVLMGYGLTALAVAPILARSEKVQKIWMWVALIVHVALMALAALSMLMLNELPEEEFAADESFAFYTSTDSYWEMVRTRLHNFLDGRFEIPIMVIMGIGVFILSARLYRAGLFQPEHAALRRKVVTLSFGIGLPLDWGLRLFASGTAMTLTRYVTSTVVAFGVLALIAAYYVRRDNRLGTVGVALAAVGRMALTCYILQNILASIVFYDFGFGLARRIGDPGGPEGSSATVWVITVYVLLSAILIAFSMLWLRRFNRGPVELLMHRAYELGSGEKRL